MTALLLTLLLAFPDNPEKTQKKQLEAQVKTMTAEAERLERSGQLAAARIKYAESQALIEMKNVTDALKRLDDEIKKRVKDRLNESHKLYEARKYKEATASLDEGMKLQAFQSVLAYDLALCYYQLGEREKAFQYLNQAKASTLDPKQRQKLLQLASIFATGETGLSVNDIDKTHIISVNRLSEGVGVEASLEDAAGDDEPPLEPDESSTPSPAPQPVAQAAKTPVAPGVHSNISATRRTSLCNALADLKSSVAASASATFDRANCAESNGRTTEAIKLLEKYLELSPAALDKKDAEVRISDLKALAALPAPNGAEIRRLYASVYTALAERKYDRALTDLSKAAELSPDFALTKWKLGLLYEAMGDVDQARENYLSYVQLETSEAAKDQALVHLGTLDAKHTKYDEEVDAAGDIIGELFNRSMNLTFNSSENRSALRAKRAQVNKKEKKMAKNRVGGFAVPYGYAQQQLGRAGEHLQIALALFPLGAEANELMALVFLQANDGRAAIRNYDVVASENLPVSFYAEMRGNKQDRAVKCELTHDRLRFIYLSSYDKKGDPTPPAKPAGEDGLGDLIVDASSPRQKVFDSFDLTLADIKKVETFSGLIRIKLAQHDVTLAPIYLPAFTPVEGPPARRFANNYTRLFVRYPGLEDSKLGTEGMTGGEKFQMGASIANASIGMAMGGFTGIGAIGSVQDAVSIARTIHGAMASLSVTFATWEKSVDDQQQLLAGKSFKAIPIQPVSLAFVQDTK
jgi:tetratricopeptide (TPR) repeat protein